MVSVWLALLLWEVVERLELERRREVDVPDVSTRWSVPGGKREDTLPRWRTEACFGGGGVSHVLCYVLYECECDYMCEYRKLLYIKINLQLSDDAAFPR